MKLRIRPGEAVSIFLVFLFFFLLMGAVSPVAGRDLVDFVLGALFGAFVLWALSRKPT